MDKITKFFLIITLIIVAELVAVGLMSTWVRQYRPQLSYPRVTYEHSPYGFDPYNKAIPAGELNEGHAYDWIETENGYDLVLHFADSK